MGWTGTHINEYELKHNKKEVVRKEVINDSIFEVLKDSFVGSTYYAAVRNKENNVVFAIVMLTSIDNSDYFNFNYKLMDETEGPYQFSCPKSILKLLTPTEHEIANEWRISCFNYHKNKSFLEKCPCGTKIKVLDDQYVKCPPAYQFKKDWWQNAKTGYYIKKKDILFLGYETLS